MAGGWGKETRRRSKCCIFKGSAETTPLLRPRSLYSGHKRARERHAAWRGAVFWGPPSSPLLRQSGPRLSLLWCGGIVVRKSAAPPPFSAALASVSKLKQTGQSVCVLFSSSSDVSSVSAGPSSPSPAPAPLGAKSRAYASRAVLSSVRPLVSVCLCPSLLATATTLNCWPSE